MLPRKHPRIPINKPFFVSKITCFIKIKNICILFKTFYSKEIGYIVTFCEIKIRSVGLTLLSRRVCPWRGTSDVLLRL